MQSNVNSGLETQLVCKDKEWKELLTARVHQLESFLRKAQEECSSLSECYRQLKEDFQFNLAILDERDKELEKYEFITALNEKHNSSVAGEMQKQTEEYERMTWDLQCKIQGMEQELTLRRQEMTRAFECELRQQEHEFNMKMDEMCAVVLSYDLKMKLLSEETKVHCHAHLQATEDLKASKEFCQQILTELQYKEQEIKDLTAVKDYKIKELEDKLKWMETRLKMVDDNHTKKYEDLIQVKREYDAQLEAQCQAHTVKLQRAEKHIAKLQEKMEDLTAQARCLQEDQQKAIEQKDKTIQRYKQQLSASLKRERALEQLQVQVELEWQRRCEDMKAKHFLANEQLIQDLTRDRDQAKAELKEKEQELQDLTVLLRSFNMERHQATQGLTPKVDSVASEEIHFLREQNSILQTVVTQMRKDMERLNYILPYAPGQPEPSSAEQFQGSTTQIVTRPPAPSTDICFTVSSAGGLCIEKPADISALMKQEVRETEVKKQSAQIQEKKPYLLQQTSGLMADGLCENVQGDKNSPPFLHTRLKKAAFRIARLSREKQELIEMCNCLRDQITTTGVKGSFLERASSTETQHDKHNRLSTLEQLQYQVTTMELQHGLRQKMCTLGKQLLTTTNKQGPSTKDATSPCSKEHKTTYRPESSKNKEKTCLPSQSQSSLDMSLQLHSGLSRSPYSSGESLLSLNELWEKLDHGLSPSIFSSGGSEVERKVAEPVGAGIQIMAHGITRPIHSQLTAKFQQRRNPSTVPSNTTKTIRPGAPGRHNKIRNYNVKD